MRGIELKKIDQRLVDRFEKLVRMNMTIIQKTANGIKSIVSLEKSMSQVQASWRFFNNRHLAKLKDVIICDEKNRQI